MKLLSGVVALDGHDGAGKTTLARDLAEHISGVYARPFQGATGEALLAAGAAGDLDRLIEVGDGAIRAALDASGRHRPVVLDRGWMTVASLCAGEPFEVFAARWRLWIPTALCWADLPTTLDRLSDRDEHPETVAAHRHYLDVYRCLADRTDSLIVRTDLESRQRCLGLLSDWVQRLPSVERE
jgi:hypothetical protein